MAGGEADLVFDVRQDPGEVLRRRVDAFRVSGRRRVLVIAVPTAVVGVLGGVAAFWDPSFGGPLVFVVTVVGAGFLIGWGISRSILRERALARPFAHARYRLVASRSGIEYQAADTDVRISWFHAVAVRDHDAGLLLVFDGPPTFIDIPPWCFADDEARERAKAQLAAWITPTTARS